MLRVIATPDMDADHGIAPGTDFGNPLLGWQAVVIDRSEEMAQSGGLLLCPVGAADALALQQEPTRRTSFGGRKRRLQIDFDLATGAGARDEAGAQGRADLAQLPSQAHRP